MHDILDLENSNKIVFTCSVEHLLNLKFICDHLCAKGIPAGDQSEHGKDGECVWAGGGADGEE